MEALRDRVNPSSLHIPSMPDTANMSKLRGAGAPAKMYKLQPGWGGGGYFISLQPGHNTSKHLAQEC